MSAPESEVVSTRTRAWGRVLRRRAVAATPSVPGILRSIRTTSGSSRTARSTASSPFVASPTTSKAIRTSSMPLIPVLTTGWSSTIRTPTLTASPPAPWPQVGRPATVHRQPGGEGRPPAGLALHAQRAARVLDPLPHGPQPEPAVRAGLGSARLRLEADAVVHDVERHPVDHVGEREDGPGGPGVLPVVVQDLLRHPEQRDLRLGRERHGLPRDGHVGRNTGRLRPAPGEPREGLGQGAPSRAPGPSAHTMRRASESPPSPSRAPRRGDARRAPGTPR